jgi:hypothetical protein
VDGKKEDGEKLFFVPNLKPRHGSIQTTFKDLLDQHTNNFQRSPLPSTNALEKNATQPKTVVLKCVLKLNEYYAPVNSNTL